MIREFLQHRRHKKALINIRSGMLSLGIDLSHLSDEEIEDRVVMAAKTLSSTGMPAHKFAQGLHLFAVVVNRATAATGERG